MNHARSAWKIMFEIQKEIIISICVSSGKKQQLFGHCLLTTLIGELAVEYNAKRKGIYALSW